MEVAKVEAHQSGMIVVLDQVEMPPPVPDLRPTLTLALLCGQFLIPKYCNIVVRNGNVPPLSLPVLPMAIPFD